MQPTRFVCTVTAGVALGALLVGRGLILPAFDGHSALIDANLAKALAGPIHLRIVEVVLAANVILACLAERWLGVRWGKTLALVGVGAAAVQRFFLLPKLYETWARADLVAGRPVDRLDLANQLHTQDFLLAVTSALLLLAMLFVASREARPMSLSVPSASTGSARADSTPDGSVDARVRETTLDAAASNASA